jgi:hypothetical protein
LSILYLALPPKNMSDFPMSRSPAEAESGTKADALEMRRESTFLDVRINRNTHTQKSLLPPVKIGIQPFWRQLAPFLHLETSTKSTMGGYLRHGRPQTADRHLFFREKAPRQPMNATTVSVRVTGYSSGRERVRLSVATGGDRHAQKAGIPPAQREQNPAKDRIMTPVNISFDGSGIGSCFHTEAIDLQRIGSPVV